MALTQDKLKLAEFARNVFAIELPPNTTIDDVKKPEFWAHVAGKLHPTDRIEVLDAEGTFFAELFVVACARNWAKVSVLRFVELVESVADGKKATKDELKDERAKYVVEWTQGDKGRVVRLSDKQVITKDHASKAAAEAWLEKFISELV
jgi:hypothetical protein